MSSEDKGDVLKALTGASVMIRCLPELPGFNGSILTIDDEEAHRIEQEIDSAYKAAVDLREATTALVESINKLVDDGLVSSAAMERLVLQPAIASLARIGGPA